MLPGLFSRKIHLFAGDNITVVIAFLRPVLTLEQIYSQGKHKHRGPSSNLRMQQGVSADEMQDTY